MTTSAEWLAKARRDADKLRSLINRYHPCTQRKPDPERDRALPITAPTVEGAAENVRRDIRAKTKDKGDPSERFDAALAGDLRIIGSVLSDAWFGVPESTSCWSVLGFRECVALIEDPPEDGPDIDEDGPEREYLDGENEAGGLYG
jgi:hypothetical protein